MATQLADDDALPTTDERDYEEEARSRGWTPKDEFKGDETRWIDAETFVKNAETKMPLLTKENKQLKDKIEYLERTVKKLTKAEQMAYSNAIEDLKAKQREAVEYGDVKAHDAISEKIDKLRADMTDDAPPEDPKAAFVEFREANEWYDLGGLPGATDTERRARALADRVADKFTAQGMQQEPGMTPAKFFAKVAEEVREQLPMLDAKPARQKPQSDVAGTTRPGAARSAKNGANLPTEAKAQAKRFFERGIIKAKDVNEAYDKFAKDYAWD